MLPVVQKFLIHLGAVKGHHDVLQDLIICLLVLLVVPVETIQSFQSEVVKRRSSYGLIS